MAETAARTCLDGVNEAERLALAVRGELSDLDPMSKKASLARMLLRLSELGAEVSDDGEQATGRARLIQIQREFADHLAILLGRPVLIPPLKPFRDEALNTLTDRDVRDVLASRGGAPLVGAQYQEREHAGLRQSDLKESVVIDSRFTDVDFTGARFSRKTILVRTKFIRCRFDEVSAANLRASSLVFEDCSFNSADFGDAAFGYCVFLGGGEQVASTDADFSNASFSTCRLSAMSFNRANLTAATFTECAVTNSMLEYSLTRAPAVFCETTLVETSFAGSSMAGAVFRNCDLRGTRFVDLAGLQPASLRGADFSDAFNRDLAIVTSYQRSEAIFPDISTGQVEQELRDLADASNAPPRVQF